MRAPIYTHTHRYAKHPTWETHALCVRCGFAVPVTAITLGRNQVAGWETAGEGESDWRGKPVEPLAKLG